MSDHTVKAYDEELSRLKTMIAQMGGLAEEQLAQAIDALSQRDTQLADQVIADDAKIDELELAIEERSVTIIAQRQPMASDLREVMSAIRIASDLERIGDLAKNLAKRTQAMSDSLPRQIITRAQPDGHAGPGAAAGRARRLCPQRTRRRSRFGATTRRSMRSTIRSSASC